MTSFNPISIFVDAWRVTRGTTEMIVTRQVHGLKIRLESKCPEEINDVWKLVYINTRQYLAQQGLESVSIVQALNHHCVIPRVENSRMCG